MPVWPGLIFLRLVGFAIAPPVIGTLVVARLFHCSVWFSAVAPLLVLPVSLVLYYQWRKRQVLKAADRCGATFPKVWHGGGFGDMGIIHKMIDSFTSGYLADCFWEQHQKLGPTFMFSILWGPNYFTSDPNVIKAILSTNFQCFEKGPNLHRSLKSVLGEGVFNSDGDLWKFHRSMTRPFFSKDRISHFELFDRHARVALRKMKERLRVGHPVDFQDLIGCFTLDSASEFLFGSCVHSLDAPLPYPYNATPSEPAARSSASSPERSAAAAFAHAFASAQHIISARSRRGLIWPLYEFFEDATAKHMCVVDAYLQPILEEGVERARYREAKAEDEKPKDDEREVEEDTLLDSLVKFTKDPKILHDEVLNILIAGRDTTASTLTIAVYFLSIYPDVLKRLREEVLMQVGPVRRPTYEDIREMKYLRAVLNETMRLYPAVPLNIRFAVKDTTLPNHNPDRKPFFVPAGLAVSYSVFLMQRMERYWGPDAMEFDPDRFLDERVSKYLTPNPFIFLPFNAGPRICLGQQFAYNEMSFFMIRLLQAFSDMSLALDAHPPEKLPPKEWANLPGRQGIEKFWPKVHLTTYSEGGLWVRMTEAQCEDPQAGSL